MRGPRGLGRALIAGSVLSFTTLLGTAAGAERVGTSRRQASQVGSWASPVSLPSSVVGVHALVLRTGKVLFLTGFNGLPAAFVWDPATGQGKLVNPPDNVFCGGQTFLDDGRVILVGGLKAPAPAPAAGINAIDTFDPVTEKWTRQPSMQNGRWYPTTTRLTDGRILITAGRSQKATKINQQVEIYNAFPPASVSLFGPNELLDTYPHQWVLPNGKVFATATSLSAFFDTNSQTWTTLASHIPLQGRPAGVLLPGGPGGSTRIMLFGGEQPGSPKAMSNTEVFDTANPQQGWVSRASIPQARNNMNTVLLPDGTILGVGGNSSGDYGGQQLQTLLYDPSTNQWTGLASQVFRRGYHSTAVLLPDGRVLSSGDTGPGSGTHTLEIYSPPYLFRGSRPSVASAPSQIGWGQQFTIGTSGPVTRAALMSPGATTHNDDMNQRHIELAVSQNGNGLTATAPAINLAPPGWYMLFVLNASGVPSTASWVHVGI